MNTVAEGVVSQICC